jgi:site-specific recombinase XerC
VRRVAAVELDLDRREIKVRGKGGRDRAVRIDMRPRAGLTGTCGSVRGTSRRTCLAPASRGPARTMAGVRQLGWGLRAGWS